MEEIELVEWIDSSSLGAVWVEKEEVDTLLVKDCVTIGFLFYEDSEVIKLVQSVGSDCVMNITVIPKGCIKSIKELRVR